MGSNFKNGALSRFGNAFASSFSSNPRAGAGLPIALSFGVGSLKILQVAAGNPPSLVAAACLDTPRELMHDHRRRLDFQLQGLPRLIKHGGFKGKRGVCMIPSWQVFCKHLQFPRQDGIPTSALVDAAIPSQLGCDPSSVVYRHIDVAAGDKPGGRAEVIVIATPRELVDRLMRGMQACRLEPVGMQSEFVAGLRAFDHIHRREGDLEISSLYLDIGTGTTKVMISHGTMLAFARVIEIGGRHIDELVAKQLNVDIETAHQRRLATGQTITNAPSPLRAVAATTGAGGPMVCVIDPTAERRGEPGVLPGFTQEVLSQPAANLAPETCDLTEPLEMLTDEVLMCVRYHASQFPGHKVERAVFIGGEARHRGLCQHIARTLKLPSQMADPLARVARTGSEPAVGVDLKQPQPGWAAVLGLCLSPTDL